MIKVKEYTEPRSRRAFWSSLWLRQWFKLYGRNAPLYFTYPP
jgi:hypothetical protein